MELCLWRPGRTSGNEGNLLPLSPQCQTRLLQPGRPDSLSQYVSVSFVHHILSIHLHLRGISLAQPVNLCASQSVDLSPGESLAVCLCLGFLLFFSACRPFAL